MEQRSWIKWKFARAPIPLVRWPEDAPHRDADCFLSVLVCHDRHSGENVHYRWAVHTGLDSCFSPSMIWRTPVFTKEELDHCESSIPLDPVKDSIAPNLKLLSKYFRDEVLDAIAARPRAPLPKATAPDTTDESSLPPRHSTPGYHQYRATQRIPAISVYCVFLDEDAAEHAELQQLTERGLKLMLRESFPCNLYCLQLRQLLSPPRATASSLLQHLQQMGLDFLFPDEGEQLLIDAGARGTTLTACSRNAPPRLCQHTRTLPGALRNRGRTNENAAPLPDLWGPGTPDSAASAHASTVRQGLIAWVRSMEDQSPHRPRTCIFTGVDGDPLLATLNQDAVAGKDGLYAVPPSSPPQAHTEMEAVPLLQWRLRRLGGQPHGVAKRRRLLDDDEKDPREEGKIQEHSIDPKEMKMEASWEVEAPHPRYSMSPTLDDDIHICVHRQRYLLYHGLRFFFQDAVEQRAEILSQSAVQRWRHDVLGCRIAKHFPLNIGRRSMEIIYVGFVNYVKWDLQFPDSIEHDTFTIQYEDGHVDDFDYPEFCEHLQLFIETSDGNPDDRMPSHRAKALELQEQLSSLTMVDGAETPPVEEMEPVEAVPLHEPLPSSLDTEPEVAFHAEKTGPEDARHLSEQPPSVAMTLEAPILVVEGNMPEDSGF